MYKHKNIWFQVKFFKLHFSEQLYFNSRYTRHKVPEETAVAFQQNIGSFFENGLIRWKAMYTENL